MDAQHRLPLRHLSCAHGRMGWREAGAGPALVLLHGIGSASLSWSAQVDAFADRYRVIAWDAPGYAQSDPLPQPEPLAADYAAVLAEFLTLLGVGADLQTVAVVGHSLGALIAAAWAAQDQPLRRVGPVAPVAPAPQARGLVLASPARGYGQAPEALRQRKWQERVQAIERLGPERLADERVAQLCAAGASAAVLADLRRDMANVTRHGYAQAAYMLAHDDLLTHLRQVSVPVTVLCGELDRVTPPAACAALAAAVNAPFRLLPGVAHACYVEDAAAFNAALDEALVSPAPNPLALAGAAETRAR